MARLLNSIREHGLFRKCLCALLASIVAVAVLCIAPKPAEAAENWLFTDDAAYYIKDDNTFAYSEWVEVDGVWYFFESNGKMAYFWFEYDYSWFLIMSDGTPYTGWAYFDGAFYFFDEYGRIAWNEWVYWDGNYYYLDYYCRLVANRWVYYEGYWFHVDEYGRMQLDWQLIDGNYHYFGTFGYMVTDDWAPYGNIYYRLNSQGTISTSVYPVQVTMKTVQTPSGTVQGLFLTPQGVRSAPTLVYSHGLGGSGFNFWYDAIELAGYGIASYLFDFVGGSPMSFSGGDFESMTIDSEKAQLNSVISAVSSWSGVNTRRVFLVGHSQGGLISTIVASERNDIAGIVLFAPALNLGEMLRSSYSSLSEIGDPFEFLGKSLGYAYAKSLWDINERDVLDDYNGYSLVFHGTQDTVVDPVVSVRAKLLWDDNCTLHMLSGCTHNTVLTPTATVLSELYDFVWSHESSYSSPWWPFSGWPFWN